MIIKCIDRSRLAYGSYVLISEWVRSKVFKSFQCVKIFNVLWRLSTLRRLRIFYLWVHTSCVKTLFLLPRPPAFTLTKREQNLINPENKILLMLHFPLFLFYCVFTFFIIGAPHCRVTCCCCCILVHCTLVRRICPTQWLLLLLHSLLFISLI